MSIGNFDGVHRGHRELLKNGRELAGDRQVVAVTFDPHPVSFLYPAKYHAPLMTIDVRAESLLKAGADAVVILQTSAELLSLEPEAFFETILCRQLKIAGMVEGFNFHFGRGRQGDNRTLQSLCDLAGIPFREVPPLLEAGVPISTSRVRDALLSGDVATATALMGHRHAVAGIVGHGAHRGRTIGIPTANLNEITTVLPADGVYAVIAEVEPGRCCAAVANIGPNPTFGENARKVEVHILDHADANLYDRMLKFEFVTRLRDTQKFAGVDELLAQIRLDVERARLLLNGIA